MRRLLISLAATVAFALAVPVSSAVAAFGFEEVDVAFEADGGGAPLLAGAHPSAMTTTFHLNTVFPEPGAEVPDGAIKGLTVKLPPGFTGSQTAVPFCPDDKFIDVVNFYTACPDSSAVGVVLSHTAIKGPSPQILASPVFNLAPSPGKAAKLGFVALEVPITIDIGVSSDPPYNLIANVSNITQAGLVYGSELILWGNPSDEAHDPLRGKCVDYDAGTPVPMSQGVCKSGLSEKAFITLPRACTGPLTTSFEAVAWGTGDRAWDSVLTHDGPEPQGMVACSDLGLVTETQSLPTTRSAESSSGLSFDLAIDNPGLLNPKDRSGSDVKKTVVTLPPGVTVNPAQAEGLQTCSQAQFVQERKTFDFGAACPAASKIGDVEVETPLLEGQVLRGSVFVATPFENQFGSLVALYMTVKSRKLGINVALPGKVDLDPVTGRLVTTFDDLPQIPFSAFRVDLAGGDRAPLVTPSRCGSYATTATFTPWANPAIAIEDTSTFTIDSGPGGAPCPASDPFAPSFEGGSVNNNAASYSPFQMRIQRRDGEQPLTRLAAVLPPGVTGKLAGLSRCSDAALAAAPARTGRAELAQSSCPADSQIGRVLVGAGVGGGLTYVPGKMFLAGPYRGAPLSIAVITPAVAGPFDVGTVVVRVALNLNPVTGEVEVDGASSDPIPQILAGIPLKLRDLRVYTDRPNFMLNPTSCNRFSIRASLFGSGAPFGASAPYQAANCATLKFAPRLSLSLKGGTRRAANPALTAVLRPRPGEANIGRASVTLPSSAFLDQEHIRTICTRERFAADTCPKGSIYGRATAWTPLLDKPLKGNVYLRSNGGARKLPDLVADLRGEVRIELSGYISSRNGGIRTVFAAPPDAPVSKFVLNMQGGSKGLISNSRNLCRTTNRAEVRMTGHNGKVHEFKPEVKATSCKKK